MAAAFISASDFSRLAEAGTIDPDAIRFSQNSISPTFKGEHGSVADLSKKLRSGRLQPEQIEPIRIVLQAGKVFTLDNRRLKAFQDAGIEVP